MLKPDYADYLERKRATLGMDREDALIAVQALLDAWYPGQVRAKRLHQGTLRLVTPSASVAGELRMRHIEMQERCTDIMGDAAFTRIAISIGSLE
jgi:hypothetical protein